MPFISPQEPAVVSANRVMIVGPPNSFKTASLLTWPRPIHILVNPGEKGDATIPRGVSDINLYLWKESEEKLPSGQVVDAVETLTWEVLGGKYGPVETFASDGIHKYYGFILDWLTGGAFFKGQEFEPRIYGRVHEHFRYYIQRIMASQIPRVVFTCWDGREPDDPGSRGGSSHVYPDLPGKMAKAIMGEFSVVVYSLADWAGRQPGKLAKAEWQLLPEGKVWGAAVKAPLDVILKLPVKIPQSYTTLRDVLAKGVTS